MPEGLLLQRLEGSDEKGQSLERQREHPAMRDAGGELYNVKNTQQTNTEGKKDRLRKFGVLREQSSVLRNV